MIIMIIFSINTGSIFSQIALKHDRKNYNALLFFGRACQELGKFEDSKKALMVTMRP